MEKPVRGVTLTLYEGLPSSESTLQLVVLALRELKSKSETPPAA
jgi:hypothetical protein